MSDAWSWSYDPDREQVVAGLPDSITSVVEHTARQLAELGRDACEVGTGHRLRVVDIDGGAMLWFLPLENSN
ncbi:hypothetical protein NGB36_06040 [Streptomyces sp. RB6PN25]|uniref:Glyoxalase-like domain-containing protein n=1 Tax=Streptomyces humicola TaxID=2953240 RepID=A0ABT1PR73_9ACTN|nr:hypothetical protein [Streptomyces humicola]MCQ4080164.1 hypothetical protein [Streptomyces humicola]